MLTVEFELDGQTFIALNGGPAFNFTEALSLQVMCDSQKEIDHFWDKLGAGGPVEAQICGWLKDRYGVSWQICPRHVGDMSRPGQGQPHAAGGDGYEEAGHGRHRACPCR